ncbi:MAG: hypothetical protein ABJN72_02155 [Sulfitobacter sp.]
MAQHFERSGVRYAGPFRPSLQLRQCPVHRPSKNGPFWKAENAKADLGGDVGHPLREILTGQMPFDVPDVCVSTKKVLSPQDMLGQTLLQ